MVACCGGPRAGGGRVRTVNAGHHPRIPAWPNGQFPRGHSPSRVRPPMRTSASAPEAYAATPAWLEAFAAGRNLASATIRNRMVRFGRHRLGASHLSATNLFSAVSDLRCLARSNPRPHMTRTTRENSGHARATRAHQGRCPRAQWLAPAARHRPPDRSLRTPHMVRRQDRNSRRKGLAVP